MIPGLITPLLLALTATPETASSATVAPYFDALAAPGRDLSDLSMRSGS